MAFRFQKRIKIAPGLRLNISKTGISASIGTKGATLNLGKNGAQSTVGLPGTGLSYRHKLKGADPVAQIDGSAPPAKRALWRVVLVIAALAVATIWAFSKP